MIPDELVDILERPSFASVATIGPDGAPHNSPVWFQWDGETINFSQTPDRQKMRNLRRDNRIALSILDPDDPYRYIEIRGRVVAVDPDPDYAFIQSLAHRYLGRDNPWLQPGEERLIVRVEPEHITSL